MPTRSQHVHDVAIVGGGIGGSLLAAILARHGIDVTIMDASAHPRFAIGESTIPETSFYMRILADRYDVPEIGKLGAYANVQRVAPACGVKRNFGYVMHHPGEYARPEECIQLPTWPPPLGPDMHYFRQDVDAYLFNTAVHYGALSRPGMKVQGADFTDSKVIVHGPDDTKVHARYIIDAGGRYAFLPQQLGLRHEEPRFLTRTRSLFCHFTDVPAWDAVGPAKREHGLPFAFHQGTLHHIFDGGWMWVIPFDNHRTSVSKLCSVGINLDIDKYPYDPGVEPKEEFWQIINRFPSLAKQFATAREVRPYVSLERSQFSSEQIVGDRFCLLPHASDFVEPLNSSGLTVTLTMVNALAHRLIAACKDRDFSPERFAYVEEWTKKSFTMADLIVSSMFVSFTDDFDLFSAGLRPYVLPAVYSSVAPTETWLRYARSKDRTVFDRMERAPLRGALSVDNPQLHQYVQDCSAEFQKLKHDKQSAADTIRAVYEHPMLSAWSNPTIALTNAASRLPVGTLKPPQMVRFMDWSMRKAPQGYRGVYLTRRSLATAMSEIVKGSVTQARQAYTVLHPYLRDHLKAGNCDWKTRLPAQRPAQPCPPPAP